MASPLVEKHELNTDAGSLTSFLTEDMFDKAMNNIQVILDDENSDVVFIDEEMSEMSSNSEDNVEIITSYKENVDQNSEKGKTTGNSVQSKYTHTKGLSDTILPNTIIENGLQKVLSNKLTHGDKKKDNINSSDNTESIDSTKDTLCDTNGNNVGCDPEIVSIDDNHRAKTGIVNEKRIDKNILEIADINCEENTSSKEVDNSKKISKNNNDKNNISKEKFPLDENINPDKEICSSSINVLGQGNCNDVDYTELSDDDDCVLDDVLEKEMESNLMAEIGLPPATKRMCIVLDDYDVNENEEDIVGIERTEAEQLNEEVDMTKADASSMVECILDSNHADSSLVLPPKDILIPNTSYTESSNVYRKVLNHTPTKVKTIYVPRKPQSQIVKPVIQSQKQNKNIKYLIKVNNNTLNTNVLSTKLKLIPVQKPVVRVDKQTVTKNNLTNDNSFKEDNFKKLVLESQLPPYASSNLVASSTVHRCQECQDTFLLPSSLKYHISRRSIIISYWCSVCQVNLKFHNRCEMLKHIRIDNQSIKNVNPKSINLQALPINSIQLGLPKCITETWEKESLSEVISKYVPTHSQEDNATNVASKSKSLTSVIKIPRMIIKDLASMVTVQNKNLEVQNSTKTYSKNICGDNKESTHEQSTVTTVECNLPKKVLMSLTKQNKNVSSKTSLPEVQNCTKTNSNNVRSESTHEQNICPSFTTVECNVETEKPYTNIRELLNKSPEIRINGVYSLNSQSITAVEDTNLTQVAADMVKDLNNLLNDETEENMTNNSLDLEPSPSVEEDLSSECEIISLENQNEENVSESNVIINSPATARNDKFSFCGECSVKVIDMMKHLNQLNRPIDPNLTCMVCRLVLPSNCALKIHLRIHMKLSPFKCPECGKQFSSFRHLYPHIKYVCGHLSRLVKYVCSKCSKLCSNVVQLQSHIFSLHTNRVFKCNICTFAYFNTTSLKRHQAEDHSENNNPSHSMYQQCTLCPNKLIPKANITTHISEHAQNRNLALYSYPCPGCRTCYTNNKPGFITHLAKCDKVLNELEKLKVDNASIVQTDDLNNIDASPVSEDEIIEMCEKDPLSLDDWEGNKEHHVKEKRIELCIVCKKEQVIIMPGADLNKQSLCCNLCVKPFDIEKHVTTNQIKKKVMYKLKSESEIHHISLTNNIIERKKSKRPIKRKMSLDFEYDTKDYSTSTLSEKSDSTCSSPENKKIPRSRPKFKKSKTESSSEDDRLQFVKGQIIPENQSDKVCSKCGLKAYNVDEFRKHVISHRTDPNAFQCLECGLCFVVRPTLEKHLIVLHRIKNVEEYIQNNDVGGPIIKEEPEDQAESLSNDITGNQCRVCSLTFDSSSALNQHFRTHGMAFLMSSQRQSKQ